MRIILSLSTVVVHSKESDQTFPPVGIFLRKIRNVQIELNGNMLFLHMHLANPFQNGEMVIESVSKRMVRSLREESVQRR